MDKNVIIALAKARARKEAAQLAVQKLELDFYATPDFLNAAQEKELATAELTEAEKKFNEVGLADYNATHEKKCEAHEIRLFSTVEVDESAAIAWSIHNFTPALSLNKKVFETAVKAGSIPDGLATVKETPKVYIKSDLSAWLKEE